MAKLMVLMLFQERDNMQKSEFLKALSDMWKDFDARVLRYKVCVAIAVSLLVVIYSFNLLYCMYIKCHF